MARTVRIAILLSTLVSASILSAFPAQGESAIVDRVGAAIESMARQLSLVGRHTEEIIAPSLALPGAVGRQDFTDTVPVAREFRENYPVAPEPRITISNEFGEIRVNTWDNRVVRVVAEITVGADTEDLASKVAQAIVIHVDHVEDGLDVRTIFPDVRDMGHVPHEVNYAITVPQDGSVVAQNNFGDTIIHGIEGTATVLSRFGVVDLRDIGSPVEVKATGEFPLQAYNLAEGGAFILRGAQAEVGNLGGVVRISSYLGSVTVRELASDTVMDVLSESGPLHLYLQEADSPDLTASVVFGEIHSDMDVARSAHGGLTEARRPEAEARQQVALYASFDNIYIHQMGDAIDDKPSAGDTVELFRNEQELTHPSAPDMQIAIDAIRGDVRVTSSETDAGIRVVATKFVRVGLASEASAALAAMDIRMVEENGRLIIRSVCLDDLETLGATTYRTDLRVECPPEVAVAVVAQKGNTAVSGMCNAVTVEQGEGVVTIEKIRGPVEVTNRKGSVRIGDVAGPATVSASYGAIDVARVQGKLVVSGVQGNTVIDGPGGEVHVRNSGGDVRILALDGIAGAFDVVADQGNIGIVMPANPDATLLVTASNGLVHSAIPLTGTTQRDMQRFQARLANGLHPVSLETRSGNIIID
jgi:hypothetical protein